MWREENEKRESNNNWKGVKLPCNVKLLCYDVTVYTGAGYEYVTVGSISENNRPVITEIREGKNSILWGSLKSGAGWIPLEQVEIIQQ